MAKTIRNAKTIQHKSRQHQVRHLGGNRHEEGMVAYKACNHAGWWNYWDWQLHVNQGWREAELLAKDEHDFLFEYEMPNGRRYLHQVSIGRDGKFEPVGKSVNRRRLPAKWRVVEGTSPICPRRAER